MNSTAALATSNGSRSARARRARYAALGRATCTAWSAQLPEGSERSVCYQFPVHDPVQGLASLPVTARYRRGRSGLQMLSVWQSWAVFRWLV